MPALRIRKLVKHLPDYLLDGAMVLLEVLGRLIDHRSRSCSNTDATQIDLTAVSIKVTGKHTAGAMPSTHAGQLPNPRNEERASEQNTNR